MIHYPGMKTLRSVPHKKLDEIAVRYHLALIFAFGSHIKGYATEESDLDIAVLPEQDLSAKDEREIISKLTHALKDNVDLTVLTRTTPLLKMQLVRASKLLYGDPKLAARFRTQAVSEYLDTAHLRAATRRYLQAITAV